MVVFRIARKERIEDLSGRGAELFGGRWNEKGYPALYTASSLSLAALEILAHTDKSMSPVNMAYASKQTLSEYAKSLTFNYSDPTESGIELEYSETEAKVVFTCQDDWCAEITGKDAGWFSFYGRTKESGENASRGGAKACGVGGNRDWRHLVALRNGAVGKNGSAAFFEHRRVPANDDDAGSAFGACTGNRDGAWACAS